jgi:diguanylate cyclase (GGDEF)-like protein
MCPFGDPLFIVAGDRPISGSSRAGSPPPMFELITDPIPPSAVVDSRRLRCVQLAIPTAMAIWLTCRWPAVPHPVQALVGVALMFVLVSMQQILGERASTAAARIATASCCGAACALAVGANGGIACVLGVPCLLVVLGGTLDRGSREVDLGVGAAVGALAPLVYERSFAVTPTLEFAFAALAGATMTRALERLLARARAESDRDSLTGTLNRAAFGRLADSRLAAVRGRIAWGMIMLDLDDFGALNKSRGHLAGDATLVEAAKCLRAVVPEEGFVGRLGGDEFAALVPAARAQAIAHGLRKALLASAEPISASVGVACESRPDNDWIALLKEADVSLRAAKRDGKGQVMIFAESIEREATDGRRLMWDMIEGERIRMVVQPIVDLHGGGILAYEALARFEDDSGYGPAHWFSLAESLGMRVELELACLKRAIALQDELNEGVMLAVNASAQALHDPRVRRLLLGCRARSLIVELTEESLVRDLGALRADLEPLLARGIKLAIDDMGAGYSNLRQVTALGPSLVKLDRTLVHEIDVAPAQSALIDALIGYAQRTGAQIVAEGIETQAELEVLRALGVTYGQGYLLAAPAPPWPEVHVETARPAGGRGPVQGSRPVTIDVDVTSDEARRRFAALPELESLTIVDGERRPLGLITRHRLLTMLGHRFGYALWGDKSIMQLADRDCLCLPADTPIDQIARCSLARPLDRRHDPVLLVDEQGLLIAHVTMGDMLFAGYLEGRNGTAAPNAEAPLDASGELSVQAAC